MRKWQEGLHVLADQRGPPWPLTLIMTSEGTDQVRGCVKVPVRRFTPLLGDDDLMQPPQTVWHDQCWSLSVAPKGPGISTTAPQGPLKAPCRHSQWGGKGTQTEKSWNAEGQRGRFKFVPLPLLKLLISPLTVIKRQARTRLNLQVQGAQSSVQMDQWLPPLWLALYQLSCFTWATTETHFAIWCTAESPWKNQYRWKQSCSNTPRVRMQSLIGKAWCETKFIRRQTPPRAVTGQP